MFSWFWDLFVYFTRGWGYERGIPVLLLVGSVCRLSPVCYPKEKPEGECSYWKSGHWAKPVCRHTRHYWETKDLRERERLLAELCVRVYWCLWMYTETTLQNPECERLAHFISVFPPLSNLSKTVAQIEATTVSILMNPSPFMSNPPPWNVQVICLVVFWTQTCQGA